MKIRKTAFAKQFLVGCLMAGLVACSSTEDEIDETEPVELTEISPQFKAKVLWEESVGDGAEHYFSRLKPVVAYDKIFAASREGDVYAFDLQKGKELWHSDLRETNPNGGFFAGKKSALISGGLVAGINKVFLGSENGKVYALDTENGSVSWQGKIKGEVITPPALDAGTLVVNSASGKLKAFNANNGEEQWTVEQEVPPLTLRGISTPVIAAGGVIVGAADGTLTVYILENGQQGWTTEVGEATGSTELQRVVDVDSKPLIYGDKAYSISSRGHLAAIDLRSGRIIWKRKYSSYRQIAVSGNSLFITDVKGHIYAVDRNNGLEKWSQLSFTNRGVTGAAVVKNYIVVGDYEGYLHWLDQDSGEIVARHQVDSSGIYATPTVENDILYVQSRDGDLQAIETP